jgi:hypothetical protein
LVKVSDGSDSVFFQDKAAEAGWTTFREEAEGGTDDGDGLFNHGAPLFLDHMDQDMEDVKHLCLSNSANKWFGNDEGNKLQCLPLAGDPQVLIDKTGMLFDKGRWGASASVHDGLKTATAAVFERVLEKMPPLFHQDEEYRSSRTYREDYASALASMEKALRQSCHVDTYK